MKHNKHSPFFICTALCTCIAIIPVFLLFVYSLEDPIRIVRYMNALSDIHLNQMVPIKLNVHTFSTEQYYNILITQDGYIRQYFNSALYAFVITAVQLFIGSLVACSISCYRVLHRNVIYILYSILALMPFQVLSVPNFFMLRWMNLLNTPWAIILPGIFGPFVVFILRQYMVTIPCSLVEATAIDGGNYWAIYRYVIMPICKPAVVASGILLFADTWNIVEQPLILLQDKTIFPLSLTLVDSIQNLGPYDFAAMCLFILPPLLMLIYFMDDLVLGIQIGDLK